MSRRCRASLVGGGGAGGDLNSGCSCARLGSVYEPCTEPAIYGGNILRDPGFEQQLAIYGGGPQGNEVPKYTPTTPPGLQWPSDSSKGPVDTFWAVSLSGPSEWTIEFNDAHSGTFHIQRFIPANTTAFGTLRPYRRPCDPSTVIALDYPYSAIVGGGDLVVLSWAIKADVVPSNADVLINFETYQAGGATFVGDYFVQLEDIITTDYTLHTVSWFVPEGSYYLVADINPREVNGPAINILLDTMTLGLIPSGEKILLCAQSGLITIDNSTVEEDFL